MDFDSRHCLSSSLFVEALAQYIQILVKVGVKGLYVDVLRPLISSQFKGTVSVVFQCPDGQIPDFVGGHILSEQRGVQIAQQTLVAVVRHLFQLLFQLGGDRRGFFYGQALDELKHGGIALIDSSLEHGGPAVPGEQIAVTGADLLVEFSADHPKHIVAEEEEQVLLAGKVVKQRSLGDARRLYHFVGRSQIIAFLGKFQQGRIDDTVPLFFLQADKVFVQGNHLLV
ncbi:hypothetical protein SDC9_71350 [bioreactor metagenome]|uniref:Uncharacterized protein n=1 Tax=bioreactor metagenome TaxID=1076179 RepID=A0A644Y8C5_9ZZZZ